MRFWREAIVDEIGISIGIGEEARSVSARSLNGGFLPGKVGNALSFNGD